MKRKSLARIMLVSMSLSMTSGCSALPLAPQVQDRRWRPEPNKPGVWFYDYEVCLKKFLGICTKKSWKTEELDSKDAKTWKSIQDMGMTMTSERRWQ